MHQYSVTSEGQLLVPLKAIQSEKDAKKLQTMRAPQIQPDLNT